MRGDGKVMAVNVTAGESTFDVSAPKPLFDINQLTDIDVAPDGQRFAISVRERVASPPLTLVTGALHPSSR